LRSSDSDHTVRAAPGTGRDPLSHLACWSLTIVDSGLLTRPY
jgi:hypothetical protein